MNIEKILSELGYSLLANYVSSETNKFTLETLERFALYMAKKRSRFDLIN